jgi:hypothetical protein
MDEGSTYSERMKQRLAKSEFQEYTILREYHSYKPYICSNIFPVRLQAEIVLLTRHTLLPILSVEQKCDILYCSLLQQSS